MASYTLRLGSKEIKISLKSLSVADAMFIEDEYGKTWDQWNTDLQAGKLRAAAVGVLALARRSDPSITMQDILTLDLVDLYKSLQADAEEETQEEQKLRKKHHVNPIKAA